MQSQLFCAPAHGAFPASTNEKAAFLQMSGTFARNEYCEGKMTESGPLLCRAIFVKIIICQANCLEKKNMQSATFSKRKLEHFSDWVLLKWINADSWSLNHQLQKNQTQALSIIKKKS